MIVAGAAGVEAGHDGTEGVASRSVGEDVAAQTEPPVVVCARGVGLPQVHQGPGDRAAGACQHHAGKLHRPTRHAGLAQIAAPRRFRFEERALDLGYGRLVAVMAGRGRRQARLGEGPLGKHEARCGKCAAGENVPAGWKSLVIVHHGILLVSSASCGHWLSKQRAKFLGFMRA